MVDGCCCRYLTCTPPRCFWPRFRDLVLHTRPPLQFSGRPSQPILVRPLRTRGFRGVSSGGLKTIQQDILCRNWRDRSDENSVLATVVRRLWSAGIKRPAVDASTVLKYNVGRREVSGLSRKKGHMFGTAVLVPDPGSLGETCTPCRHA